MRKTPNKLGENESLLKP